MKNNFLNALLIDFPLKKAQEYAKQFNPFLVNDLEKVRDILNSCAHRYPN